MFFPQQELEGRYRKIPLAEQRCPFDVDAMETTAHFFNYTANSTATLFVVDLPVPL